MTKRQLYWIVPLLLAAVYGVYQFGFAPIGEGHVNADETEATSTIDPLPVNVQSIEKVDSFIQNRTYVGTVRAKQRSDLGFEVSGRIESILVDEGDKVEKGQLLGFLDTQTLEAQKSATLANLQGANAQLLEMNAGPRKERVEAARSDAIAAKSRSDVANLNLKRRKRLRESAAISEEDYDQALFASRTADSNYESALQRYRELAAGTRQEKILAQKASVAQLESMVKEVEVAIEKSTLTAPFSGTVTRRYLDPGSIAPASTPIIKLVEQNQLEAWIGLPIPIANKLNVGDSRLIMVSGQAIDAKVGAKLQELNSATQTQTVIFGFQPQAASNLLSGQLCEIEIESRKQGAGFWIPTRSLSKGIRGLWSVLIVDKQESGHRVQKRDVEVINTENDRVLVRGTLNDGEQIVIDGLHRIAEGQLVSPKL
jgi:multidrug efflux pump subunit AcrA (membrane-fusion protein)